MVNRFLLFFVFLPVSMVAQNEKITLLFSSELEGELNGFSPELNYTPLELDDDGTYGGYSRIASLIKQEKQQADGHVFVLDLGNSLMGSLFSSFEDQTGFQLSLMHDMGYDAAVLGQKDFSYGPQFLSDAVNTAYDRGDISPFVISNLDFNKDSYEDNELALLFVNDVLKSYQILEYDKLRIGLLAIHSDLSSLDLAQIKPLGIADPLKTAQKFADYLYKEEHVDQIILVCSGALEKNKTGDWEGVPIEIAEKVKGIDLILMKGPKLSEESPFVINGVPIIQAKSGGMSLGKVIIEKDNDEIKIVKYSQVAIDDKLAGDVFIDKKIKTYQSKLESKLLTPFNLAYYTPVVESSFSLKCNKDLQLQCPGGSLLLADALHSELNKSKVAKADVSLIAISSVQENMDQGKFISSDLIRLVNSSGYESSTPGAPVVEFYLNVQELNAMMELLYQSPTSNNYPGFLAGGIKAKYNATGDDYKKVQQLDLLSKTRQFITLDRSKSNTKLYAVVANTETVYLFSQMAKASKSKVKITPKDQDGKSITDLTNHRIDFNPLTDNVEEYKEWHALLRFVQNFSDINGNGIPDMPDRYNPENFQILSGSNP